jgi:hypothetical protein
VDDRYRMSAALCDSFTAHPACIKKAPWVTDPRRFDRSNNIQS